ncbi:hypothetical protein P170DRAFT_435794 [Aspergillus steynii IBT 23096]|uniref:Uncharacterized protein n=1 Tax=Aspergillus steynii IBT 23096 TaxID=1392250 RepID=A0A2I2GCJ5_9EURO|nr:uncharacterized protein P170DRAFT_435794 [Aspergillus steynii IBT 23096]PLB50604.1 hypothetical protein P170DRAFT_435794 [Aspergillus steynii IBT 23096]
MRDMTDSYYYAASSSRIKTILKCHDVLLVHGFLLSHRGLILATMASVSYMLSPAQEQITTSALAFRTESDLLSQILSGVIQRARHKELVYTDVEPAWGSHIVQSLNVHEDEESACSRLHYNSVTKVLWVRLMPTEIHACHQLWVRNENYNWMVSGQLTLEELKKLRTKVGMPIRTFKPPYDKSCKEPDLFIRPGTQRLPSVVVETGWEEAYPRLRNDVDLWLLGGRPYVKVVMLLKWTRTSDSKVKGSIEVYSRDLTGIPAKRQSEVVFPAGTEEEAAASLHLTRGELFGEVDTPGRDPNDVFQLSIESLRMVARNALQIMKLSPA